MPFFRRKSRQQSDQPAIPPAPPKVYPTAPKAVFPLRQTDDYSTTELAKLHETAQHLALRRMSV